MKRVPRSTHTREAIEKLLADETREEDPKNFLVRLMIRVLLEEAQEIKVRDSLGHYDERSADPGYRNGHRE